MSFISNSSPDSAAVATISAFFILLRADLEGNFSLAAADSPIGVATSSTAEGAETSSASAIGLESSSAPLISGSLFLSIGSDPPNNLEKKPFFFVSFLSLIT